MNDDDSTGMTYTSMGDVLVEQEGCEKEATLMHPKMCWVV